MHAGYVNHEFTKHSHEGYAFGVIEQGNLGFRYRGESLCASVGNVNLVNPDEPHDGYDFDQKGWLYRMFYFEPYVLAEIMAELTNKEKELPFFQDGVIVDKKFAGELLKLHADILDNELCTLEVEERVFEFFLQFVMKYSDSKFRDKKYRKSLPAVTQAKEYLLDNCCKDISLDQLSSLVNVSKYHFIRIFRGETGLTPHKFLIQARLRRLRKELLDGEDLAEMAYKYKFADQAHMSRCFRDVYGVSPGNYRNFLQE
jgi:AraC-like DNA-binding protein